MKNEGTRYQRQARKILLANGWKHIRRTGKGYDIYRKPGHPQQVVSSSPSNPGDALKSVQRFAGVPREGRKSE